MLSAEVERAGRAAGNYWPRAWAVAGVVGSQPGPGQQQPGGGLPSLKELFATPVVPAVRRAPAATGRSDCTTAGSVFINTARATVLAGAIASAAVVGVPDILARPPPGRGGGGGHCLPGQFHA